MNVYWKTNLNISEYVTQNVEAPRPRRDRHFNSLVYIPSELLHTVLELNFFTSRSFDPITF